MFNTFATNQLKENSYDKDSQSNNIYFNNFVVYTCCIEHSVMAVDEGMVLVPAGKFDFGDEDEGTFKKIDIKAFYIDKYEITNEQYRKFKVDHKFPSDKGKHPVTNISWHDANTYCKSIGKRLPTEMEWEKAARGTEGAWYPWGDEFDSEKVNSSESNMETTVPVGKYEEGKSIYGIYDMSGNVREWVDGWFSKNKIYRVVRGGSYIDDEDSIYTFTRRKSIPEDIKDYVGFRCAK